jgi:NAD(P)-dependent dehydrogenase (short-subunit alcohol dehydrogenase family)
MRMDEKIVRQLARRGAAIAMVCRDRNRGNAARAEIAKVASGPAPTLLLADLSSQASIRSLAAQVRARFPRVDVLINNAGAMFALRELTTDGVEKTFGINHLAPFLLTNLLLDLVKAAPTGRIITVASESHSGTLDFDNLQGERKYNFFAAYNRSKLGNILFTYELARRLRSAGVPVNCMSPGPTKTEFGSNMSGLPGLFPKFMKKIPLLMRSPEKGAETLVHLASSTALAGVTGRFFSQGRETRTKKITYNNDVAARLWNVSDDLCGGGAAPRDALAHGTVGLGRNVLERTALP